MNLKSSRNKDGKLYQYYRYDWRTRRGYECGNEHTYDYAFVEQNILHVLATQILPPTPWIRIRRHAFGWTSRHYAPRWAEYADNVNG